MELQPKKDVGGFAPMYLSVVALFGTLAQADKAKIKTGKHDDGGELRPCRGHFALRNGITRVPFVTFEWTISFRDRMFLCSQAGGDCLTLTSTGIRTTFV
jgi:hypothetical protein